MQRSTSGVPRRLGALLLGLLAAACGDSGNPLQAPLHPGDRAAASAAAEPVVCPTSLDPADTSCLDRGPGVSARRFGIASTSGLRILFVSNGGAGGTLHATQTVAAERGLGTVTQAPVGSLTSESAWSDYLEGFDPDVIVVGRMAPHFSPSTPYIMRAVERYVRETGAGFITEWNAGSGIWSEFTPGSTLYYYTADANGAPFGFFTGSVDRGETGWWSPWTFQVANVDHPVVEGLPSSFGVGGMEFCYRVRGASSELTPLFTVNDAQAGGTAPVMLAGDHGAGRAVLWLCDWDDNSGQDANLKRWLGNAIAWSAEPGKPADASAPEITPSVTGTAGAAGWYTSDVEVSWTVEDAESPIESAEGCDAVTVDEDTDGRTFTCTATSAGGTASKSVTVRRDATAPVVTGTAAGTLGNDGWYTSDVEVSWSVADDASPVTSEACAAVTVDADTGGATFVCQAVNEAGLKASASVTVKRDATRPVVGYTGNLGTYTVDQAIAIACSASDATSGVASSTCADVEGAAHTLGVGSHTVSAAAVDAAGNEGGASATFEVRVTPASLCALARSFVGQGGVANSLCAKLDAAAAAAGRGNANAMQGAVRAFLNEVEAQTGKSLSAEQASVLATLARAL